MRLAGALQIFGAMEDTADTSSLQIRQTLS